MNSLFLKLNLSDFQKGLITAVIAAVISFLYTFINAGGDIFMIDWMEVLKFALGAGIAYLSKNLLSNSDGKFGATEA